MEYSLYPKRYRFLVDNIDYFQEKMIVTEDFIRSCIKKDIFSIHEGKTILVNSVLCLNFIEEVLLFHDFLFSLPQKLIRFKMYTIKIWVKENLHSFPFSCRWKNLTVEKVLRQLICYERKTMRLMTALMKY